MEIWSTTRPYGTLNQCLLAQYFGIYNIHENHSRKINDENVSFIILIVVAKRFLLITGTDYRVVFS